MIIIGNSSFSENLLGLLRALRKSQSPYFQVVKVALSRNWGGISKNSLKQSCRSWGDKKLSQRHQPPKTTPNGRKDVIKNMKNWNFWGPVLPRGVSFGSSMFSIMLQWFISSRSSTLLQRVFQNFAPVSRYSKLNWPENMGSGTLEGL